MSDPGNVSIVAIGPLTNTALAMRLDPRLAASIREILVMGGSLGEGNKSAAAESNALADPHAMRIMFESDVAARCGATRKRAIGVLGRIIRL